MCGPLATCTPHECSATLEQCTPPRGKALLLQIAHSAHNWQLNHVAGAHPPCICSSSKPAKCRRTRKPVVSFPASGARCTQLSGHTRHARVLRTLRVAGVQQLATRGGRVMLLPALQVTRHMRQRCEQCTQHPASATWQPLAACRGASAQWCTMVHAQHDALRTCCALANTGRALCWYPGRA